MAWAVTRKASPLGATGLWEVGLVLIQKILFFGLVLIQKILFFGLVLIFIFYFCADY